MSGEKCFLCPSKGAMKSEDVIRCSKCKACYHPSCSSRAAPLPDGSFKKCCGDLNNRSPVPNNNSARSLSPSDAVSKQSEMSIKDLWSAIKAQMTAMSSKIANMDERLSNMDSKLDLVSQLSVKVADLESRLSAVENAQILQASSVPCVDMIAREVQDRMDRANNIILHKVEEPSNGAVASDLEKVRGLLGHGLGLNLEDIRVKRLGKLPSNAPRPLLVRLSSHKDVMRILKSRTRLPAGVSVSTDRTQSQRDQLKKMREEVVRLNAEDSSSVKTIKYVDGVPSIVDKPARNDSSKN